MSFTPPSLLEASHTRLLQWSGEISHYCPEVPIILVACKKDLRDDEAVIKDLAKMGQHPVSSEEVRRLYDLTLTLVMLKLLIGHGCREEDRRMELR
jgi:GTPase SAR1 family protein